AGRDVRTGPPRRVLVRQQGCKPAVAASVEHLELRKRVAAGRGDDLVSSVTVDVADGDAHSLLVRVVGREGEAPFTPRRPLLCLIAVRTPAADIGPAGVETREDLWRGWICRRRADEQDGRGDDCD